MIFLSDCSDQSVSKGWGKRRKDTKDFVFSNKVFDMTQKNNVDGLVWRYFKIVSVPANAQRPQIFVIICIFFRVLCGLVEDISS
jgi:hypothetical protein